jgi:hypothetical protein
MAQNRFGTAGEHGCHPVAMPRQLAMTDREHTSVNGMQRSACQPVADNAPAGVQLSELPPCDHSMLALRQQAISPLKIT